MASAGRTPLIVIGVCVALALAATGIYFLVDTLTKAEVQPPKNVLFITIDDYRPEMGFYHDQADGYTTIYPGIRTPNMDKLATKSAVFTRAYTQFTLCCPSRSSFLTSRRPLTTRVFDLQTYWRTAGGNFTSLPQYFKQAGFVSAGAGKVYHRGGCSNGDDPISWTEPYFQPQGHNQMMDKTSSWRAVSEQDESVELFPDQEITEYTRSMLQNLKDKPFFLAVGYLKPHLPFVFPARYLSNYPQSSIEEAENTFPPENYDPEEAWCTQLEFRAYEDIGALNYTGEMWDKMPAQKSKDLRRAYYSCVTYVDDLVGQLMDELKKLGLQDNTIVVVLGDHGYQLGEHRGWGKQTTFEASAQVPLIIHIPGVTDEGIVLSDIVELVDVFPTLAEAAGLAPLHSCTSRTEETCTEGDSLLPIIHKTSHVALKEGAISHISDKDDTYLCSSLRTERYRYTETVEFHDYILDWDRLIGIELYDYENDPQGNINVANYPEYNNTRTELRAKLRRLV